jgi:hypothetical protein
MALGPTTKAVKAAALTVETASQSVIAGNIAVQVILSASFNQMWLMVNTLQITTSFEELNLPMPGNVSMVMIYIINLASFNVFPTDQILNYLF